MAKGDSNKVIQVLKKHGLRVTSQRRVVLNALLAVKKPMSHSQVVSDIGEQSLDPATVYRNLVKLTEVGILKIVSRADGIDRYALAHGKDDEHQHPHFVCDDCGEVSCLPIDLPPLIGGDARWSTSVQGASIQLRGECPDCLEQQKP